MHLETHKNSDTRVSTAIRRSLLAEQKAELICDFVPRNLIQLAPIKRLTFAKSRKVCGTQPASSALFFLAQPNERLSIVGHLDTSATKIKKVPAAHTKHRTKHKNNKNTHNPTQTKTTQHNTDAAHAAGR